MPVPERILKPNKTKKGYQKVFLYKEGNGKAMQVHRLVAQAFLPNTETLPMVNHKDENPSNNHVDNLEWCDARYNVNYGTGSERSGEKRRNNTKQSKPVQQFTIDGSFVMEWPSAMECRRNGFGQGHVSACCRGERKRYKGFIWKYKEDASA